MVTISISKNYGKLDTIINIFISMSILNYCLRVASWMYKTSIKVATLIRIDSIYLTVLLQVYETSEISISPLSNLNT